MDWLNWLVRIFSLIGGIFFLFCFLLGFWTFWGVLKNAAELYKAKRKFHHFQRQSKEFKDWMNQKIVNEENEK